MRLFGHPVHVMLLHFPVALWPAHLCIHLFATTLPAGAAAGVGFWLLAAGTALGWLAAFCGLADLAELGKENAQAKLTSAVYHAAINGSVLIGLTTLTVMEYSAYPSIRHGAVFLVTEAALLVGMTVGNYFGGKLVWGN